MRKFILILSVLLVQLSVCLSQQSYANFKAHYKPHNKLNNPADKTVAIVNYMDVKSIAGILEEYVKSNDYKMFTLVITSIDRQSAGEVIDVMKYPLAIKGLNMLEKYWLMDILFYTSETTYNAVSAKLKVLKNH
jgi:hypothetical protein